MVGWKASRSKETVLVLDTIEQGLHERDYRYLDGGFKLVHHSDSGSQSEFNWSSQHLDRGGVQGWRR
ncbi:hypothetical protein [Prauserella halophila]|uniref:hypothetical protein n=1 Tax=Prauserella halophila TaxID=185641 RepID=UPI0035561BB3